MAATATLILTTAETRERAIEWVRRAKDRSVVSFKGPKRTLSQNDRLHAMITDVATQIEWNGKRRDVEAWKDIFTAALLSASHDLDVVPGINGGFVLLGLHTSSLSVEQMGDLMTLIEAFCAERGIILHDGQEAA